MTFFPAMRLLLAAALVALTAVWPSIGGSGDGAARAQNAAQIDAAGVRAAQPSLVRRALDALAPERPGVADLYFVGFAGDATQDVFIKELREITRLMDARFDTAGRSVMLINHANTVATVPLANGRNLRTVLNGIAERMDRDEDMLFLYLTSHGSETHELFLDFPGLGLNNLPARELAGIIDGAGIKWRVIVISACYSGGFIDPLENENTLVITAARRDRTSFGCSNESEFTYFGQAYFDQALRDTFSFTRAFAMAKVAIARRERGEGLTPSEPQIFLGAAIRDKLAALEWRLAGAGR